MARLSKMGKSLGHRVPARALESPQLKEDDAVELIPATTSGAVETARNPTRKELVEKFHQFRGLLPADFKFDREEANSR